MSDVNSGQDGGQMLYNDLCRRLITHILDAAPETDPNTDIELRLVALIHDRAALAKRVEELELVDWRQIGEQNNRLVPRVHRLEAEITRLKALVEKHRGYLVGDPSYEDLESEITRLREELNDLRLRLEASDEKW